MRLPIKMGNRYEYNNWYSDSRKIELAKLKNINTMQKELTEIYKRLLSNHSFEKYVAYLKKRGGSKTYRNIGRKLQAGQTGNYGVNVNIMHKTSRFLQKYFKDFKH
tara:strand:- start:2549 stop:2866 length:318 start_codon:yes stop_codon:yes gene_type:complete